MLDVRSYILHVEYRFWQLNCLHRPYYTSSGCLYPQGVESLRAGVTGWWLTAVSACLWLSPLNNGGIQNKLLALMLSSRSLSESLLRSDVIGFVHLKDAVQNFICEFVGGVSSEDFPPDLSLLIEFVLVFALKQLFTI